MGRVVLALTVVVSSSLALLEPTDDAVAAAGSVSGLVFNDYNSDGRFDVIFEKFTFPDYDVFAGDDQTGSATDHGIAGIEVRAYDASGALVGQTTSLADGSYTVDIPTAVSTSVRVEFTIPSSMSEWVPSFASVAAVAESDHGTYRIAGPSVQFVELGSTDVDFAVLRADEYCQSGPSLVTCYQPVGDVTGTNLPGALLVRSQADMGTPYLDSQSTATVSIGPTSFKARSDDLGSVFGIGVDRSGSRTSHPNAFFGTYVKRHSEYGNAGATNTVYRVPLVASGQGPVTTFVTFPGTPPAHSATDTLAGIPYSDDRAVFDAVGRIGLGDVDVTPDGRTLLAVDMDETAPKLHFVPILGSGDAVTAGAVSTAPIPRPTAVAGVTCPGIWHPMGLGTRGDRILVGGVCGAEDTVSPTTPRGPAPTQSTAFVLEYTGALDGTGTFTTIFGMSLGYPRGCAILAYGCGDHATATTGSQNSAHWTAWNEFPRWQGASDGTWASNPQAMLANIEIADNGDLVLGFRDRFSDQAKTGMLVWTEAYVDSDYSAHLPAVTNPSTIGEVANVLAAGDTIRVCHTAGAYTLESGGTCVDTAYPGSGTATFPGSSHLEYYWDAFPGTMTRLGSWPNRSTELGSIGLHVETTNGSLASMPGYHGLWSTGFDAWSLNQQAVIQFGHCSDQDAYLHLWCFPTEDTTASYADPITRPEGYGSRVGATALLTSGGGLNWPSTPSQNFAKGNGLADLEMICNQAPLQIGDRVWNDLDGDGIQDPGETPIEGVTVRLYSADGTLVGTARTDANGHYYFSSTLVEPTDGRPVLRYVFDSNWNLVAIFGSVDAVGGGLDPYAEFTVRFDEPADYAPGGPLHGYELTPTDADTAVSTRFDADHLDSDGLNGGTGIVYGIDLFPRISVPQLGPGETDHSFDLGVRLAPRVAIGDRVWIDENGDGLQDAGDTPLAGVTVHLLYPDGTPVEDADGVPLTTVTDAQGGYLFDDLAPWQYMVEFERPAGMWSTLLSTGQPTVDSDPDPMTDRTSVFLVPDQVAENTVVDSDPATVAQFVDPTIDAGYVRLVAVGDVVWVDADRDGVQDAGESPIAGVVVQLFEVDGVTPVLRADGTPATATTGADGTYVIDRLFEGTYVAKFLPPADYALTHPGGGTSATDSNPDPFTWLTPPFTLTAAATGDMVVNSDPTIDALYIDPTIDAGVIRAVGFGDRVWIDDDGDGIQNGGSPLAGVIVHLLDIDGDPVLDRFGQPITAVTDASGAYFVDGLASGDYRARFELPPGYRFTVDAAAASTAGDDSNPDPDTGITPVFTIAASVAGDTTAVSDPSLVALYANRTIDAGVVPITGFGDHVWSDADGDGVQDPDELPVPGVVVHLLDASGEPVLDGNGDPITQTTDARGNYFFADLVPGDYRARFELPAGHLFTATGGGTPEGDSDADPVTGITSIVTVTNGPVVTVDAGIIPLVGIGDVVWIDADADGLQDPGESPLAGVVVHLLDADGDPVLGVDGEPEVTATDDAGGYFFDGLLPGRYRVRFDLPEFYRFTAQSAGESGTDSNPDTVMGITPVFTVEGRVAGDTTGSTDPSRLARFVNLTIDAGVVDTRVPPSTQVVPADPTPPSTESTEDAVPQLVGFGDVVWVDLDWNGRQDPGEPPIEGVVVHLLDEDGVPVRDASGRPVTAATDVDGRYFIDGLRPGSYRARFELPCSCVLTRVGGGSAADDSNPDPATGTTPVFTVAARASGTTTAHAVAGVRAVFADLTIDAGVVWVTEVRGSVTQNGTPIEGLVVMLLDEADRPVLDHLGQPITATIAADGTYILVAVPTGRFRIGFATSHETAMAGRFLFTTDPMDVVAGPGAATVTMPVFDGRVVNGMVLPTTGSAGDRLSRVSLLAMALGAFLWMGVRRRSTATAALERDHATFVTNM